MNHILTREFRPAPTLWPSKKDQQAPVQAILVLGEASISGKVSGMFCLEMGPKGTAEKSRLWSFYEQLTDSFGSTHTSQQKMVFNRICVDPPTGTTKLASLEYWIDPNDALTRSAALGCDWLTLLPNPGAGGLRRSRLNTLMLGSNAMSTLLGHKVPTQ